MAAVRFAILDPAKPDVPGVFRRLFPSSGYGSGAYLLVERETVSGRDSDVIKRLLRDPQAVAYVGGSVRLGARVLGLLASLRGRHSRHHLGRTLIEMGERVSPDRFLVVLVPFWATTSLEAFLLDQIGKVTGDWPRGNLRRACRTSGSSRLRRADVTWSSLGLKINR